MKEKRYRPSTRREEIINDQLINKFQKINYTFPSSFWEVVIYLFMVVKHLLFIERAL